MNQLKCIWEKLEILKTIIFVSMLFPRCIFAESTFDLEAMKSQFKRPSNVLYPESNPYSPERENLGKMLFFDPRLSGSNVMSCATCHNPSLGWSDGLKKGVGHGHKTLGRKTPTLLNLAWGSRFFLDGRAESLEEQALGPIQAKAEMNQDLPGLIKKLRVIEGYSSIFAKAFPQDGLTPKTIAEALATFERSIVSSPSPFDRWIQGEEGAISSDAKEGFKLFNTKARCGECHSGWNFTDGSFHDIGVNDADIGRGKILPKLKLMQHAFKTPTLRGIAERPPYLHDGSIDKLEDVIALYIKGGEAKRPSLSPLIKKLDLDEKEVHLILVFLKTLSSDDPMPQLPKLPQNKGRDQ